MPQDAEVWRALLRAKGLTVAELAKELHTTRQHAHRLLTGRRKGAPRREDLDRALALGSRRAGRPLYAVAVLGSDDELELVPAGDAQPLFADREIAGDVAARLGESDGAVCAVPVWPEYAWRRLVAFHAAWGSAAEPRNVFLVDESNGDIPLEGLLEELLRGYAETLRLRGAADDPALLDAVEASLQATLTPAVPQ